MNTNDRAEFAKVFIGLCEYHQRQASDRVLELYWHDLERYPLAVVLAAIESHRYDPARGRFFPLVADLVQHIEGTVGERALAASSEVRRLCTNSRAAKSADPTTEACVAALGGWHAFGHADERSLGYLLRDFEKLYAVHATRGTLDSKRIGLAHRIGPTGPGSNVYPLIPPIGPHDGD